MGYTIQREVETMKALLSDKVFIDTSALVAFFDRKDSYHAEAGRMLEQGSLTLDQPPSVDLISLHRADSEKFIADG